MAETVREKVIVPVKGTATGNRGLLLAKNAFPNADIMPLHVIVVKRSLPLDAEMLEESIKGDEILEKAEKLLSADNHHEEKGEILQARNLGSAILVEGEDKKAIAVVMGIRLKDSGGISNATKDVLSNFKGEVILYRSSKPTDLLIPAPRSKVFRLSRNK